MHSLIVVSLGLIIVIPVIAAVLYRRRRRAVKCGYQRAAVLFSPEERHVYAQLRDAVGDRFEIFGRIPVGEIIRPRIESRRQSPPEEYEELAAHCFSFVLCDRRTLAVEAAMEVWRQSRDAGRSASPEDRLRVLCDAVGLPLIVLHPGTWQEVSELRAAVLEALTPLALPHYDRRKEPRISGIADLDLDDH